MPTPRIYANHGYDSLKDFAPIALLGRASNVMIVHPDNPASPAEVIQFGQQCDFSPPVLLWWA